LEIIASIWILEDGHIHTVSQYCSAPILVAMAMKVWEFKKTLLCSRFCPEIEKSEVGYNLTILVRIAPDRCTVTQIIYF